MCLLSHGFCSDFVQNKSTGDTIINVKETVSAGRNITITAEAKKQPNATIL